jgi:hypothetical protein
VHACASENFVGMQKLESNMKKIALAAALSLVASTAFAGGVVEAMPEEVVAAGTSSSGGAVVPLLLLLVVAAAVASN